MLEIGLKRTGSTSSTEGILKVLTTNESSLILKIQKQLGRIREASASSPKCISKGWLYTDSVLAGDTGNEENYDLLLLRPSGFRQELIEKYEAYWKRSLEAHFKSGRDLLDSRIFWVSRDHQDHIDDISHYRFWEKFRFPGYETTFSQVENRFAQALIDGFDGKKAGEEHWRDATYLFDLSINLLMVSRSPLMSARLYDICKLALKRLQNNQHKEGPWKVRIGKRKFAPSVFLTACALVTLQRLGATERTRDGVKEGVKWLEKNQHKDGVR